jgi:hypothetical protein
MFFVKFGPFAKYFKNGFKNSKGLQKSKNGDLGGTPQVQLGAILPVASNGWVACGFKNGFKRASNGSKSSQVLLNEEISLKSLRLAGPSLIWSRLKSF